MDLKELAQLLDHWDRLNPDQKKVILKQMKEMIEKEKEKAIVHFWREDTTANS